MNKKNEDTTPVEDVAPVDSIENKAPKPKFYQLVGANTFVADYLDGPVHKDDTVSSASLKKPGIEAMETLLRAGIFKMLSVLMVVGALLLGSAQASAQETGSNFQYQSKIGWGGAYLQTLPTVFAEVDALFTSIGSATTLTSNLAATTSGKGASLVGVQDTATYFTGATVEAVLAELGLFDTNLGLTTNGNGASMVGVEDVGTYFTGTDVEAVLAELGLFKSNLALTTTPGGASYIGVFDTAGHFTATDVEAVLAELFTVKQGLAIPMAAGETAYLDAAGQVQAGGVQLTDLVTENEVGSTLSDYGIVHYPVTRALAGGIIPVAPADGYRTFCTADGGTFSEGKIYEYDDITGWNAGTNVSAGQLVLTYDGNLIVGGANLTSWTQIDDYALSADLEARIINVVDIVSDTAPADPNIEGYRVFMTATNGGLDEGKVYTWDDTGNVWDAGTLLADGQLVTSKGANPDIIVGGTAATNYEQLSKKLPIDALQCKTITITNPATSGASAADPDWIGATIYSIVPTSGCDQLITGHSVAGDGAVTVSTALTPGTACVVSACTFL